MCVRARLRLRPGRPSWTRPVPDWTRRGPPPVQVSQSNSRAEASKADVEKARAELEQATLQLSYSHIVSPVDGYVTRKTVEKGAFVQMGQALMAIVRPDVWVTANFKETQLTKMHPGQPVTITVDAFPGMTFTGRVESIQHGHRCNLQPAAAGKCNGQFYQGGPACAGQDRF